MITSHPMGEEGKVKKEIIDLDALALAEYPQQGGEAAEFVQITIQWIEKAEPWYSGMVTPPEADYGDNPDLRS